MDARAGLLEQLRGGGADALRAAGDDGDSALEVERENGVRP
jgi:hypothetical protein